MREISRVGLGCKDQVDILVLETWPLSLLDFQDLGVYHILLSVDEHFLTSSTLSVGSKVFDS